MRRATLPHLTVIALLSSLACLVCFICRILLQTSAAAAASAAGSARAQPAPAEFDSGWELQPLVPQPKAADMKHTLGARPSLTQRVKSGGAGPPSSFLCR